jgi:hypothetical protein
MPERSTTTRTGAAGQPSPLTGYQRLLAGSPTWPAATIAPDLDGTPGDPASDLPGVRALTDGAAAWPAATIAPDLD